MDDPKGLKPAGSGILTQREPYVINAKAGRRIFLEKVTYLGPEKLKVEGMAREDYAKAQIRVVGAHHAQKSQPNWDSVKKALKAVMDQVKPKYTILLGGDDILPYPQYNFEDYDEVFGYLLMGGTGIRLASDDYYATRNGRAKKSDVPDQIVSRMPTWRGKDSSELVSVQLESASAPEPRSARGLIVTDAAGDDQRSLFKRAEKASQALFRKGCAPAHCLPAPPYCTGALNSQGKEVPSDRCSQGPSLQAKITSADVIFTYLHGGVNAQGISAGKKEPPVYAVFHPEDFTVKRPAMRAKIDLKARHPVIFSTGCSAAEADLSCGCSDKSCSFVRGQAGIGISMLSGGARTLFGFTRDLSALSANALDLRVVKSLKSGKTAGEAFLDAKKTALEEGDVRRLRAKTREQKSEATADLFWARSFILYGDPTVTVRLP
ncbi:MAG TPA: C25 family cysteine peptidase [Candidatus Norongarragalinales archaeon]|nr:C25 family cysteine peptidase [Candidatus Norongarragalinales archaeon]